MNITSYGHERIVHVCQRYLKALECERVAAAHEVARVVGEVLGVASAPPVTRFAHADMERLYRLAESCMGVADDEVVRPFSQYYAAVVFRTMWAMLCRQRGYSFIQIARSLGRKDPSTARTWLNEKDATIRAKAAEMLSVVLEQERAKGSS